jgi:hypothetical protein
MPPYIGDGPDPCDSFFDFCNPYFYFVLGVGAGGYEGTGSSPESNAPPAPPGGYGTGIDPYGTWDDQVPAGVQAFPSSVTGIQNGSDCTFGSGSCGGIIFEDQDGQTPSTGSNSSWWHNIWILIALSKTTPPGKGPTPVKGTPKIEGPAEAEPPIFVPNNPPYIPGEPTMEEIANWPKWKQVLYLLIKGGGPTTPGSISPIIIINPCAVPAEAVMLPGLCGTGPIAMKDSPHIDDADDSLAHSFSATREINGRRADN